MNGRQPESLLRRVEQWHRELATTSPRKDRIWARSAIGEFELETGTRNKNLKVWRIRELLSSGELRREGAAMRHCVASYAGRCGTGGNSIWALEVWSFDGVEKRVTIEVDAQHAVVQCRGRFNAYPKARDREMIQRWASRENLQVAPAALGG
jgi:hypothetical protein